jgi:hypothetical protein
MGRRTDDLRFLDRHAARAMNKRVTSKVRPKERPGTPSVPTRRFDRSDGRFDLPVIVGRTPKQVARRLA